MARVTSTDKWIVGGEGEWRDLLVLPPLLKLSLDFVIRHPIITALFPIYIVLAILTQSLSTAFYLLLGVIAFSITYRFYLRYQWRKYRFHRKNQHSDTLVIPLDKKYHPSSALYLDRHILIGGDSGTGKSNTVWQIIRELDHFNLPHVNYIVDPAGGVELSDLQYGKKTHLYTDRPQEIDHLIIDFRDKMNDRLTKMKSQNIRTHTPTVADPAYFLIIDELLLCRTQLKQGVQSPLGEVLAVGRKARFIVIACTQLGQKTTLGDLRDMFPQRVAFGTRSQEMTDAILGTGASRNGAPAYELYNPGEGFLFSSDRKRSARRSPYFKFQTPLIKDTFAIAQPDPTKDTAVPNPSPSPPALQTPTQELDQGRNAVYRLYGETGVLLYVGVAKNPNKRIQQHSSQPWFESVDFERTVITWYSSREEALDAEQNAIESEMPLYNIIHNSEPKFQ